MMLVTEPQAALAGHFKVSPVRMTLASPEKIGVFNFQNQQQEPAAIQAEVMSWQQIEGVDQYSVSDDLIVSPPIFTLPPGGKQVVRVGYRGAEQPSRELAYRIFFTELPRPQTEQATSGLVFQLRLAVPVFLAPETKLRRLDWQLARGADGHGLELTLDNGGNRHVQVVRVALSDAGSGEVLGSREGLGYVLPGQRRGWELVEIPAAGSGRPVRIDAETNLGRIQAEARLP